MMDKEHVKTDLIPLFTALAEDDQVSIVNVWKPLNRDASGIGIMSRLSGSPD